MSSSGHIDLKTEVANPESTVIRIKGRNLVVPSVQIANRKFVRSGTILRVAQVFDEELVQGPGISDPETLTTNLRDGHLRADLFTFAQFPPETNPKFDYKFEWDNWAVAPTHSFETWWEGLPQESRKNARRSAKKGVTVRTVPFDDLLIRGIHEIYNETPVRQGKRFWHFGKDLATVEMENATYLERSEFLGAFCDDVLVGFIKMIYVNQNALLIQILARNEHQDKRPMNSLLARAVEVCEQRGSKYLVYGNYVYGKRNDTSLAEFKRRNGFKQVNFPRYYVPLSARGKIAIAMGLHRGIRRFFPKRLDDLIIDCRKRIAHRSGGATGTSQEKV